MMNKYFCFLFLILSSLIPKNVMGDQFKNDMLYYLAQELSVETPSILPVYIFFESYVNELLSLTQAEQKKRLEEELAVVESGKLSNLNTVFDAPSLSVIIRNLRCHVCVKNGDIILIEMSFPMSFELIFGLNKIEAEAIFVKKLQEIKPNDIGDDVVEFSDLNKTNIPKFFIKKGSSYYIPSLTSDLYYEEVDKKLGLVVTSDHFVESVANIMMSEHAFGDYSLELDIRKYGFKKETIKTTVKNWLAYCKAQDCECYFGVEEVTGENLQATIFIVNHDFQYNHILTITVSPQIIDDKKGIIKGSVNVYIPTHNIADLLEEHSDNK